MTFSSVKFFQKSNFKASKIDDTAVFELLKSAKLDFKISKSEWQENVDYHTVKNPN